MAGNPKTVNILRADIEEDLVKCDICDEIKPRKDFHSSITVCNSCVEDKNCMSIC